MAPSKKSSQVRSLHKNIQLILEFVKTPFLVVKFSYYTLMIFLMILSVILLSMQMILLSTLSMIRHLIEWKVVTSRKSSQEYPVNAGVPQGSLLGCNVFLLYFNELPGDIVCNIAIYAYDTTLYSKYDKASDLWQQLELASELESDLQDTVDWGRKWLVNFNVQLVSKYINLVKQLIIKIITRSFIMLNIMTENENTSFANILIPFLRLCSQH